MNILIVGFGNMGCRHAQSFLEDSSNNIFVIEPNLEVFKNNKLRIGASNDQVKRISLADCRKDFFSFVVVATSADVRFTMVKAIAELGVSKILLEKVVFQSRSQFDEAIQLFEKRNINAYCNFSNRYSESYRKIKASISTTSKINFTVTGGHFGFACNALHYIDLFAYLTDKKVKLLHSNITKSDIANVRGSKYVEVFGQQIWVTADGDRLVVSSQEGNTTGRGAEKQIHFGNTSHLIDENTQMHLIVDEKNQLQVEKFDFPMASKLTKIEYQQMLTGEISLPTVEESMDYHVQFFNSINEGIGFSNDELCPIT